MKKFQKINTVWKRDPDNYYVIQPGEYSESVFEFLKDAEWLWQEKIHGRNHRVIFRGESTDHGEIQHLGKSDSAHMPEHLERDLFPLFDSDELLNVFGATDVCLYGEAYGEKINGGSGYAEGTHGFCLFDVKIGDWWLQVDDVRHLSKKLGLPYAPIIGSGTLEEACETISKPLADPTVEKIRSLVADSDDQPIEGFVLRPKSQIFTRHGDRVISKIKYKDYHRLYYQS